MKLHEFNPDSPKTALLIHSMLSSVEGIQLCVTRFWGEEVRCFVLTRVFLAKHRKACADPALSARKMSELYGPAAAG